MTRSNPTIVSSGRGLWMSLLLAVTLGVTLLASAPTARAQQVFTTYSRFDGSQRLVGVIHPSLPSGTYPAERYSYDSLGRPTLTEAGYLSTWQAASVAPSAWSGFTVVRSTATAYDAYGHKLQSLVAGGGQTYAITQYSYDAVERPTCTAVRMNLTSPPAVGSDACTLGTQGTFGPDRITKQIYDSIGRVTQIRRALGTTLEQAYATNAYGADSELQSVTDANNNLTSTTYDGFDRVSAVNYPVPTAGQNTASTTDYEAYTYDAANNRLTERRRDGAQITYQYDGLNRQTARLVPAGQRSVYTSYDLLNRPLLVAFDSATGPGVAYAYDGAGRLVTETTFGQALSYAYNADSERTQVTWPDGFYAAYDYDNPGDVTAIRENGAASGVGVLASYAYDNLGRRQSLTRGNGVVTSWTLDAVSRLTSLGQDLSGTTSDQTLSFSYSPASQVMSRTSTNASYAWAGLYNIDRAYGVNGLNQLTTSGSSALSYDARGNLTSDGVTTYGYDVDNKLTTSSTGASLTYDPTGRLYQVTSSGGTVTRYIYDGPRLSAAYDSSGTLLRRFVHGPGVDEPVVWYEGSGVTDRRWLVADNQGSTVAVTNSSGAVTNLNTYDEYGVPGASNAGLFQYTGQIWIAEFGLYHYKARVYSPTLGRFLQTDPIGTKDDLDLYAYVGNDPTNKSDPTGLFEAPVDPKIAKQAYTMVRVFLTGSRIPVAVRVVAAAPVVIAGAAINTAIGSHTASNDCKGPGGSCGGPILYHYTTEGGQAGILASQSIRPSTTANNPKDARYGNGQYFTDIVPGTRTGPEISRALVGNPFQGAKFTNYVAVDMTGLPVVAGREHVFVVPNEESLSVAGRVKGAGEN